jgi:uncharacterized Tic20 family protein
MGGMEETNVTPSPSTPSKDDCTMAMLTHITALAGFIIPFGNIVGPLVVWLIKKDSSPFVDDQGKESLNFQITVTILAIVSTILIIVIIGIFMLMLLGLVSLILIIVATIKANNGERYRYPFSIRLIK